MKKDVVKKIREALDEYEGIGLAELGAGASERLKNMGIPDKMSLAVFDRTVKAVIKTRPEGELDAGDVVALFAMGISSHYLQYSCESRGVTIQEFMMFKMVDGLVEDDVLEDMFVEADKMFDEMAVNDMIEAVVKNSRTGEQDDG